MATEINTMSAAVDACLRRSGQLNRRNEIIAFIRQTMREIQAKGSFRRDVVEEQLTATSDPYVWTLPTTANRLLPFVQYPEIFDSQGLPIWSRQIDIGPRQRHYDFFWYQAGDSVVFAGHGNSTTTINVAYFAWFTPLAYFEESARPARYWDADDTTGLPTWTYLTAVSDSEQEAARNRVTNWMLMHWFDTIIEGALAKLYKLVGDDRAVTSFALFKQLEESLLDTEPSVSISDAR